jgi:hypothetical protein
MKTKKPIPMKRTSITLNSDVMSVGKTKAANRGFENSFSAYVAWLIKKDICGKIKEDSK